MITTQFGDSDKYPALTGHQKSKNQILNGMDNGFINLLIGDVAFMRNHSKGGNDTLLGGNNSDGGILVNGLIGDSGLMFNHSQGGNDTLLGGNNSHGGLLVNGLAGDSGVMFNHAKGGNDVLTGGNNINGAVINGLAGDAALMFDHSKGGNDVLVGGDNAGVGSVINILTGDALGMFNHAKGGNDELIGGNNLGAGHVVNILAGDALIMSGHAKGGNDILRGGDGNGEIGNTVTNYLYGDAREISVSITIDEILDKFNELTGINSNDILNTAMDRLPDNIAGINFSEFAASIESKLNLNKKAHVKAGNDILISGTNATDHMWGDFGDPSITQGGADTFVFLNNFGNDFIYDFRQSDGDQIIFAVTGVSAFDDLAIEDNGVNTTITVDVDGTAHGTVTLVGVSGVDLSGDIGFVF
ncbi:hypothetical protein [Nitrosomonas sp. ANs5]|uniref:hypothetical protein n=1 Tax=Nitrosomonas sp. ANs5 TaxID=3423941 RepID=UPI003D3570B7